MSITDPNCPAWYRRYVETKRVAVRKRHPGKPAGTLCAREKRNRTGCIGISLVVTANGKPHGCKRKFFAVHAGGTNRKFCVDTLGREEAWRRAVKFRADYEIRLRAGAANAVAPARMNPKGALPWQR